MNLKVLKKIILVLLLFLMIFGRKSLKSINNIYASSYILMEASSKRVLDGKNINERYLTASICKILTAIIVIENSDIDGYVTVTRKTCEQIGSSIYLEEGDMVKVRDLLYGLLLRSGNDCAYLLAIYCYQDLDTFVQMMNKYCRLIGMKHSIFCNPSGLDEETKNYSTAYDMALLMSYCMENKVFREINNTNRHNFESLNGKKYFLYNKHKLITGYDYCIGGKTGYTINANRTLVTYATKNGLDLVCVTFNCSNDWDAHINLFNYGFENYTLKKIMKKQAIKVKEDYKITPYLLNDIYLPIKKNEDYEICVYLLNNNHLDSVNKEIGYLFVYINEEEVFSTAIYSYY